MSESTTASLRGTLPEGEYVGLCFNLAVPFDKNHVDPWRSALSGR